MEELWRRVGWRRVVVTGLCLVAWRALEQIVVPGVNPSLIDQRLSLFDSSSLIHAIGSGIPLASYSVVVMGVGPFVNALVIMSLAQMVSRYLRTLAASPEGRLTLRQYARALSVVLAMGQAYGYSMLWQVGTFPPAFPADLDWFPRLVIALELTGGSVILMLLAEVIDEFGLGFGYGVFLIYALGYVVNDVHRIAAFVAIAPSVDATYRPFGVWALFSIAVVVATVAAARAVRRIPVAVPKNAKPENPIELKVLLSGVVRPPIFASAVIFFPQLVSNYFVESNSSLRQWMLDHWTLYGTNVWTDIAYLALYASLIVGFAYVAVMSDAVNPIPKYLASHIWRLTFIGGAFLALTVALAPVLERFASGAAGMAIPMSGFDAVVAAVVIVAITAGIEQPDQRRAAALIPASPIP